MKEYINLSNISFAYKENNVLNNLCLQIQKNDVIGVLGHNGAGKTTLFKMILGVFKPNNGFLSFSDNLNDNDISFLPDNNGLYDKLTVYENLKFRCILYNVKKSEIDELIEKSLRKFKMYDKLQEKVYNLSNGMKKRVALAATIIQDTKIILLDEPTIGIDPESVKILCDQILDLKKQSKTILISSHDLTFITKVCTKIIILQEGNLVFENELPIHNLEIEDVYLQYTCQED